MNANKKFYSTVGILSIGGIFLWSINDERIMKLFNKEDETDANDSLNSINNAANDAANSINNAANNAANDSLNSINNAANSINNTANNAANDSLNSINNAASGAVNSLNQAKEPEFPPTTQPPEFPPTPFFVVCPHLFYVPFVSSLSSSFFCAVRRHHHDHDHQHYGGVRGLSRLLILLSQVIGRLINIEKLFTYAIFDKTRYFSTTYFLLKKV